MRSRPHNPIDAVAVQLRNAMDAKRTGQRAAKRARAPSVEEYVPQKLPSWRRAEFRSFWAEQIRNYQPSVDDEPYEPTCSGGDEPWGHFARDCRNPQCPFVEVALPDDEWWQYGHLEEKCDGGCGCVPVLLPTAGRKMEAQAARASARYQWLLLTFQKKRKGAPH